MNNFIPDEPMALIPIGMDARDPKHNGLIPVHSGAPEWMTSFMLEYWKSIKAGK